MPIWEPIYWDEFRAYDRAMNVLGFSLYTLNLLYHKGEVPEDLNKRTIRSLELAKKELDPNITKLKTYFPSLLSESLPPEMRKKLTVNIETTIRLLKKEQPLTEDLYKNLTSFFAEAFDILAEKRYY